MITPTWSLRRLHALDDAQIDGLAAVLIDCVEGGASVSFMHPLTRDRAVAFWRGVAQGVAAGQRALLVAEDGLGLCGTVQLLLDLPENQPHRADLAKMLVHRRARRQGLGAALVRAAEATARACGKTLLVLDAVTGGEAARLYERLGWVRVGDIPDYALFPQGGLCGTTVYYRNLGGHDPFFGMRFVTCTHESHADEILDILNEAIANSTALYDYKPRAAESMVGWFKTKEAGRFPVIGAVAENGQLLGFATYGTFRAWPAYKYSVEHSVYVHKDHRGKGIGRALMQQLIAAAREQQYHVMVGGIDVANTGSIMLHEKLGFVHAGTIRHAAFKFGRWLDLGFYQLLLETPACPTEETES